ncbi:hypothetical protein [Arthrobacter sp. M4]|uniref:hypothetical protein n=1 Tax=Arthrobacter sp. M4 TaxID=218160 RepID=UPI001CDB6C9C|nr:hypothetical protein [Arthrobacter sp. M4]MCA4134086.1 hypothetical protein [Arthrobacter sp. M4]
MKWARSTIDGRDWNVVDFSRLHPERLRRNRRELVCVACGAPAFFRSASGTRPPTFGAHHREGCVAVAPAWSVFRYLQ